jgi:hypothetical protein
MEQKEKGQSEQFFSDFGRKMDQFLGEVKEAGSRVEADLKSKFEELKVAAEKVKEVTEDKERWKEVENGLKKAGTELEKVFITVFKKK